MNKFNIYTVTIHKVFKRWRRILGKNAYRDQIEEKNVLSIWAKFTSAKPRQLRGEQISDNLDFNPENYVWGWSRRQCVHMYSNVTPDVVASTFFYFFSNPHWRTEDKHCGI